jgi:heat shock protein HtpX
MSKTWWVGRAALAVALMLGYVVLGLLMSGGLLAFGGLLADKVSVRLGLVFVIGGLAALWSMLPRRDRLVEPGPRLEPQKQPRLFERIDKLALMLGQPMPREVT